MVSHDTKQKEVIVSDVRTCRNYINGQWVVGTAQRGDARFRRKNPATCEVVSQFEMASREQGNAAVRAARDVFTLWSTMSMEERREILERALEIARERIGEYAMLLRDEAGKPLWEEGGVWKGGAAGEIRKGLEVMEHAIDLSYSNLASRELAISKKGLAINQRFEPLGVVLIITAWNFPWILFMWKAMYALLAGNTIVFKPALETPSISVALIKLLEEAGLPKGVVNLVLGDSVVSKQMLMSEDVDMISFTGSTDVGNEIARLVYNGRYRTPQLLCELGGKNAALVMPDADFDLVAEHTASAAAWSAGQRCTALSRLIVHSDVHDLVVDRVVKAMKAVKVDLPSVPLTKMGPLVSKKHLDSVLGYVHRARLSGAHVATGGERIVKDDLDLGWFMQPTVLTQVNPNSEIARQEVFGPVLSVIRVESFEEGLHVLNSTAFGLKGGLYTRDTALMSKFIRGARVGGVHINDAVAGAFAAMPFGGAPNTSTAIGPQECGPDAIRNYQRPVTVVKNIGGVGQDENR